MNVFILDMNARYRVKQWEFEIRLNNLTDRRTYSVENCNDLIYTYREVKLSGIDALLSIRYNFQTFFQNSLTSIQIRRLRV